MTFEPTTTGTLKSFAGAALLGLGMDAASLVSRHLSDAAWFALREALGIVVWGVLTGWQASQAQIFGHGLALLGCPLDLLHSLGWLARLLGSAV